MKMTQSKKEIRWINYVRAISILAIYYIHAEEFFGFTVQGLARYILPFYVNAFFFVSGYLLFRKQLGAIEKGEGKRERKRLLLNIVFRLVIPSLIFSIVDFVPGTIIQHREFSVLQFIEKTVWGRTFWFISALVVAELIIYLLLHSNRKSMWFYAAAGTVLFAAGYVISAKGLYLTKLFDSNPWQFEKGLLSLIFIVLGGLYNKYEAAVDRYLHKPFIFLPLSALYITAITLFNKKMRVLISMNDINIPGVLISVLSIAILVTLCKWISRTDPVTNQLDRIGKSTIGFYFVCGSIPKTLAIVLPKILPKDNFPYMIFGFALSFALAYAVVFLMEKYIPFVFDLRRGWKPGGKKAAEA